MATDVIRYRPRKDSLTIDQTEIFNRVEHFYDQDMDDRDVDIEQRQQRYAKYRMWTEGEGGPWEGSSDVSLSDMTEKSMRLQDTLHNAVMAQRPAVIAKAMHKPNQPKEDVVGSLLDFQFFDEARGETLVGEASEKFINDGVYTLFIPWVRERRTATRVLLFPGIPADRFPSDYFAEILKGMYPDAAIKADGNTEAPWDFTLMQQRDAPSGDGEMMEASAKFYTKGRQVELVLKQEMTVFDGPLPRVLDYDDVFHPVRAANLQPPGPSNPGGATHVIIRDYPTKDEIRRLRKSKFYDLLTDEDMDALDGRLRSKIGSEEPEQQQKDDLAGKHEEPSVDKAKSHETLTRLICFDRYDIDGDGLDEDVIFWVILEMKRVVKAIVLEEMYPTLPLNHRRPFAEAALFPVPGRRVGMSMLELLEGLHDAAKTAMDQTIDANSIGIVPFGFYRPTSTMQSEVIRLAPGELYPLGDPSRDIAFPQIGNPQAQGMAINLMTILQQMGERVSVIGDLQLGRVPAGKSAALRTTSNMNLLAGQSEARPERILRRFFMGWCQCWVVMHSENQHFLPKQKQIRISGVLKPGTDPYLAITDRQMVAGEYQFTFTANALNTSKVQLQQTLQQLLGTYVNALTIQLGVATPETIYNLMRDYGKSLGADPEGSRYINAPNPDLIGPKFLAEDAMVMLLQGQMPEGSPMEPGGWLEHLQKIQVIAERLMDPNEDTGAITPEIGQMIQGYMALAAQRAQEQAQQQQMAANAEGFAQQQGGQGGQGGRPPESAQAPGGNPSVSGGAELIDEQLPGAGGGGQ
ncbi:MAG: hypothetical protein AB7I42_26025 [Bradyrhizobium sp.]|uniref:portal protein n=1 Tax=Bradyrhizobium sp. TaxID=376 RepID=UPI003D0D8DF8